MTLALANAAIALGDAVAPPAGSVVVAFDPFDNVVEVKVLRTIWPRRDKLYVEVRCVDHGYGYYAPVGNVLEVRSLPEGAPPFERWLR